MNATNQSAQSGFLVKAYQGDARTLLAFNLPAARTQNLAGFTIQVRPAGKAPRLSVQHPMKAFLALAKAGRIRIILDNAAMHHAKDHSKREDQFEKPFTQAAANGAAILRGKFGRYAHDKVFIVSDATGPLKVLSGSTNFSVTFPSYG